MRFCTIHEISLRDLLAMAEGAMEDTVSDVDFLETLKKHRCFLLPPYVMRAEAEGGVSRMAALVYDEDGEMNKARILVAVARKLRQLRELGEGRFGDRFGH